MKVLVNTSNGYTHILPAFAYMWNKATGNYPATVIYTDDVPPALPENFDTLCAGPQHDKLWTIQMRCALEQVEDELFLFVLEDYLLVKPVDMVRLQAAFDYMAAHPEVERMDLTAWAAHYTDGRQAYLPHEEGYSKCEKDAFWTMTVQPAIWRKSFMLEVLNHDETIWDFEYLGTRRLWERGHFILRTEPCDILKHDLLVHDMKTRDYKLERFPEDAKILSELLGVGV